MPIEPLHPLDKIGGVHQEVPPSHAEEVNGLAGQRERRGQLLQAPAQVAIGNVIETQFAKGEIGGNGVIYLRDIGTFAGKELVTGIDGVRQLFHLLEMPVNHIDAVK